jgi:hypothetical protein
MSDIKNLLSTIDGLAKDDDNVVFLHDSVDLELSEDFVIETGVVGFTEDGIVLEADNETIEFLELHDIILEDGRDDYQQDGAGFVFDPTGEDNPIGDDFYTYTIDAGSGTYNNGTSGVTLTITSPEGEEKVVSDNFTYFDPELGGLGNPNMQAELASWFENGHGVGDEGMAEGKRYKYSEAEGDDCEKCNGTGKLDRHSEDPHKCNACDGKGKEIWKPEPTDFSKFNIGEAHTKTVSGNTVMSDGSPMSFADWRSESEGETGKKDERSKEDIEDAYKAYVRRCKSMNESNEELAEIRKLANLNENPNPGDFNQASKSPIGSINYNDTEKMAQDNVSGKDPEVEVHEAEYQGRKVTLNKPMQGDVKKSKVYVKNAKGNVVKVNFGDKNMKIKKNIPGRRKSFRARHNCSNPGPKWKARYWSCRAW